MIATIFGLFLLALGGYWLVQFKRKGRSGFLPAGIKPVVDRSLSLAMIGFGLFLIATRSFVIVGADEVAHLNRIYLAGDMQPGQIIALPGQKGPRSEVIPPGFHFMPFVRVLNRVEFFPVIDIPPNQLGVITAKDGKPLREGQFLADPFPEAQSADMLDATTFLKGDGQRGPQVTVLRPGRYRLNQYLFEVQNVQALDVPTGHVAVVRSNIQEPGAKCEKDYLEAGRGETRGRIAAPLVNRGCIGVWREPLGPNRYYLNPMAYTPTVLPTRLETLEYKGGYTDRQINLTVEDDGSIRQSVVDNKVETPKEATDRAIFVRVEGWTVPVEVRAVIQVNPTDAPLVVASVGDLEKVKDNIITPTIREVMRSIGGDAPDEACLDRNRKANAAYLKRLETATPEDVIEAPVAESCGGRRVLDFVEQRDTLGEQLTRAVAAETIKAGVTTQEVRIGEPAIPPELLVARLREQLASQLSDTYRQEQIAQAQRVATQQTRALADQQPELVKADIARQAAEYKKEQLRLEGEGQKLRLQEIAQGQRDVAQVLGQDRALQLEMLKEILRVAEVNPEIIKVPQVQVMGAGSSLEGGAAVLGTLMGGSNVSQTVSGAATR